MTRRTGWRCAFVPIQARAPLFSQVAEARSDETFVALCLLTVTGASLLTQKLGFSDTMGAFVAGVLLAETNYSTQVCVPHYGPERCSLCEPQDLLWATAVQPNPILQSLAVCGCLESHGESQKLTSGIVLC